MKGMLATDQFERQIKYYGEAKRFLYEHDPIGYAQADRRELERLAEVLRYEDYRRHIQPYLKQKERLLSDFYRFQVSPDAPMPEWLQETLGEWDSMIAIEAAKFGYSLNGNGTQS